MKKSLLIHSVNIARELNDNLLATKNTAALLQVMTYREDTCRREIEGLTRRAEFIAKELNRQSNRNPPGDLTPTVILSEENVKTIQLQDGNKVGFSRASTTSRSIFDHAGPLLNPSGLSLVSASVFGGDTGDLSSLSTSYQTKNYTAFTGAVLQSSVNGSLSDLPPPASNIPDGILTSLRAANDDISKELGNAAKTLTKSLRSISVPKLSPNLFLTSNQSNQTRSPPKASRAASRSPPRSRSLHNPSISLSKKASPMLSGLIVSTGSLSDQLKSVTSLLEVVTVPLDNVEQAWSMLYQLTRSLKPFTPINIPVTVSAVRPLLLPVSLRPRILKDPSIDEANRFLENLANDDSSSITGAQSEAKRSSLFFDPFAKRALASKKAQEGVVWSVGEVSRFKVIFVNGTKVPIFITNITLNIGGPSHVLYPCAAEIPAVSEKCEVEVMIKPLAAGTMFIKSIFIHMNNSYREYPVKSSGTVIEGNSFMKKSQSDEDGIETNVITVVDTIVDQSISIDDEQICLKGVDIPLKVFDGESISKKITLHSKKQHHDADVHVDRSLDMRNLRVTCQIWEASKKSKNEGISYIIKDFNANKRSATGPIVMTSISVDREEIVISFNVSISAKIERIQLEIATISNAGCQSLARAKDVVAQKDVTDRDPIQIYSRIHVLSWAITCVPAVTIELVHPPSRTLSVESSLVLSLQALLQDEGNVSVKPSLELLTLDPTSLLLLVRFL